jgi:hypothetical protein
LQTGAEGNTGVGRRDPRRHGNVLPGKEVTAMARKTFAAQPKKPVWKPPAAEEITVSAEATMYMGAWKDLDWL